MSCKNIRIWFKDWILLIWIVFCSSLPDFDLFIGLAVGNISRYHQTFTHTFGFAFVAGIITFLFLRFRRKERVFFYTFITFLTVYFHVILDSLNYDSRPPIGVMLFWPFSNRYFNPFKIFYPVPHSQPSDVFSSLFANAVMREIVLLSLPLLILVYSKFKRRYAD